ncbi:ATP synthase F0 subcomplex B subunit [Pseudopedobacter saltans DSM 12145]|uniref:ATP synthase subunit b n=1 Tax=Pseudopedobacter saltans (strain ATCC 51119 / DSM 12145 / JCM 21818 / CCUG 39354 / LMG 10337 / NBRC 100064 / NCIMB 13643) TaxID=762903 RepID=F0S4N6_PSESL|nr:F0F1 ATP synthase subunit B [Pseudopedobacter saltans]ADY53054.1 ATP synthase F0 subcomplex B subunit [Pseudopedobacter saltans DSM 12145]
MELITPSIGLVFWTLVSFVILLIILRVAAWKPILAAIRERESSIEDALNKAELAKQEMARLSNENEALLKQARAERDEILKEAKSLKDKIVNEAKTQAQVEGAKLIEAAKVEINNQKLAALAEVKSQVANLSLEIAEKVLRQEFADKAKQEQVVEGLLKDIKLN